MKPAYSVSVRLVRRFVVIWLLETAALLMLVTRFPGMFLSSPFTPVVVASAILVALALSIINTLLQPLIIVSKIPFNVFTIGVAAICINTVVLRLAAAWLPGFDIEPLFPYSLLASLIVIVINVLLTTLITLDDEFAYLEFAVHMWSRNRNTRRVLSDPTGAPGMIVVQIDGLSPQRLLRAIRSGMMPTLKHLLHNGSHQLLSFDCGLPSQTSACQAGIMYGNNANVPAFRWFDKTLNRMVVSNHVNDAHLINSMCRTGTGLLRGGTSINNLINGDADKSLLTLSTLADTGRSDTEGALDDLASFWFNPYTFTRTAAAVVGDIVIEIAESIRQIIRNDQPRMERLLTGQLFMRALTNVFLRDLSAYVVMLDICRGIPIVYTTFMGYDQVAHHVGPDSSDAIHTLRGIDRQLRHILQTADRLAPRTYQLYVLSDHGQSSGATFRQRYHTTLRDVVDRLTSHAVDVAEAVAGDDKETYVSALIDELSASHTRLASQPRARFKRAAMRQATRSLQGRTLAQDSTQLTASQIVLCASGNIAHLYITGTRSKLTLTEIDRLHPQLIENLVNHPGIGIVVGCTETGEVVALGKGGARSLSTGTVSGVDPLSQYGSVSKRAEQLLRIVEFSNSGDIIINGPVYPDNTVASFEDLIGVHGGMGGQQMEAFMLAPIKAHVRLHGVTNAAQIYSALNEQRTAIDAVDANHPAT